MEKGLFEVLTEICNEKGISQEVLIDALEAALVAAYKKNFYSAPQKQMQHIFMMAHEVRQHIILLMKIVVINQLR